MRVFRLGCSAAAVAALVVAASAPAAGPSPVLHEFLTPDPNEDMRFGAKTVVGGFPTTVETPSGVVRAPDVLRGPATGEGAYSNAKRPEDALFRPDLDTRKPSSVAYEDPFSPSVTPYKRLTVFDAVDADYTLKVARPEPRELRPGGTAGAGDEVFFGQMNVDLAPGVGVRVPTPGPEARLLRVLTTPSVSVRVEHDGADNWFVRSEAHQRVRLVIEVAVPRAAFGGALPEADWRTLPTAVTLPPSVQRAAAEVDEMIGATRAVPFHEALTRLVEYYRSFTETDAPLPSEGDIFLELARSRKGVCRHRAFAFVVSALGLGIPARLVTNEAHAWVEINDGSLWRRIDLGGAAVDFEQAPDPSRVAHAPPPDPFAWPASQASAGEVAKRGQVAAAASSGAAPAGPAPSRLVDEEGDDVRPRATVVLRVAEANIFRNQGLHVEGEVNLAGEACAGARVDVLLKGRAGDLSLGSLATDENGAFRGTVTVPATIDLGDYDLRAVAGGAGCGVLRSGGQAR